MTVPFFMIIFHRMAKIMLNEKKTQLLFLNTKQKNYKL